MGMRLAGLMTVVGLLLISSPARAHSDLSEYVQHELTLDANGAYLDLTLQLTFFDDLATAQRASLDHDSNGEFSPGEQAAFKKALLMEVEKSLSIQSDGTALDLVPRFDPEIECAVPGSGGAHLRFDIRLHYFAKRPVLPKGGAALEVHDGLFREIPAMASLRVTGNEGFTIRATDENHDQAGKSGAPKSLIFKARLEESK